MGPKFALNADEWLDPALAVTVRQQIDARGLPVVESWRAGGEELPPALPQSGETCSTPAIQSIIDRASAGDRLSITEIETLFRADGPDVALITARRRCDCAQKAAGDTVSYVVNRNINYTNICLYQMHLLRLFQGQ